MTWLPWYILSLNMLLRLSALYIRTIRRWRLLKSLLNLEDIARLHSGGFSIMFFMSRCMSGCLAAAKRRSFTNFRIQRLPSLKSVINSGSNLYRISQTSVKSHLVPRHAAFDWSVHPNETGLWKRDCFIIVFRYRSFGEYLNMVIVVRCRYTYLCGLIKQSD